MHLIVRLVGYEQGSQNMPFVCIPIPSLNIRNKKFHHWRCDQYERKSAENCNGEGCEEGNENIHFPYNVMRYAVMVALVITDFFFKVSHCNIPEQQLYMYSIKQFVYICNMVEIQFNSIFHLCPWTFGKLNTNDCSI